ncbi:hypothetical protein [Flavobacterium frigoris]|uniref:Uncharacterized protein n=1 Tax=Flavobacterium frigoris (strain PS1) TaxID=1086011 RepID=H7FSX5_FLAFP|nr:hypothetical protein [Flavobacterium frigoris]EIA08827.1 hypothetical protein HJ01_02549 [Flavobacterium frigoris PS1]
MNSWTIDSSQSTLTNLYSTTLVFTKIAITAYSHCVAEIQIMD